MATTSPLFDRLLDRGRRQRERAELIGVTNKEDIGADGIPEQRRGEPRRADEVALLAPGGGHDAALEAFRRQRNRIAGEIARQNSARL
jgi:hypothetical protein